ncbi:MAG: hypothetical protein QY332_10070 [Anaerolineales bacterium]|nr:MAG: hypothetical protein QY332_10070 [Anaerolineales bacterium]
MVAPTLPKFIPITEAVRKTHLSEKALRSMLHAGKIGGGTMNGELLVDANTLPTRKEDLPEYRKFSNLKGAGIGIAEAARKYDMAFSTLQNWANRGFIMRVGRRKNKVLLDEQDVAYCVHIYRLAGGKGKRIFKEDGTPYSQIQKTIAG